MVGLTDPLFPKFRYTSAVFDAENVVDGYSGARTVHLGIDLGAPVGTKVS